MKQYLHEIQVAAQGQGLYEITKEAHALVNKAQVETGILNLSILHTSAALVIQENASPEMRDDLVEFFDRTVPMDASRYRHTLEGPDDMPAHIKAALTNTNVTLSIKGAKLVLGTWQGIFVFEFRLKAHMRAVLGHVIGQ